MLRVAEVDADATRELRRAVLRPDRPAVSTAPGDDAPGARHLAAYDGQDVVGAAVLVPEACPLWPDRDAFRLRGMAVEPGRQGQGIGALVLDAALELAGELMVWCNARSTARRFYERHGFVIAGDEFVTLDTGVEHFLMYRNLGETPPRPTS